MSLDLGSPASLPERRLTVSGCQALLQRHHEGRMSYQSGRGPRAVVVNYAVEQDCVLVRLPEYNELLQYSVDTETTLAVDEPCTPTGCAATVLVTGTARSCLPRSTALASLHEDWPDGVPTTVLRLPLTRLRGTEHWRSQSLD
jgi:hypothetical protein